MDCQLTSSCKIGIRMINSKNPLYISWEALAVSELPGYLDRQHTQWSRYVIAEFLHGNWPEFYPGNAGLACVWNHNCWEVLCNISIILIRKSVDSLCKDSADVQYLQYHICSIRRRSQLVAALPDVLNEIVTALQYGMLENPERSGTERNGTERNRKYLMHNTDVDAGYAMKNWC